MFLLVLFVMLNFLVACQPSKKDNGEESTTVSSTNKSTESFDMSETIEQKFPMNGGPSSREKDVIEGMEVPVEILGIASQNFDDYFLPEELVVETRSYHASEGEENRVVVELLDNLKTKDVLTAYLSENGQIEYYKFDGDRELYLYNFIEYFEKSDEISNSIRQTRLKKSEQNKEEGGPNFFRSYLGEKFKYEVDYNLYRGGINRFIVEIIPPDEG